MNPTPSALALVLFASASYAQISQLPEGLYSNPISSDLVSTVRAALPEARAVDVEFLDPAYQPVITLSERATVSVTFVDEGAGYRNALGWVSFPAGTLSDLTKDDIDANGNGIVSLTELSAIAGVEYGLLYPNASRQGAGGQLLAGDAVEIDGAREFPAGTSIVFCLLQNAWKNGQVEGYTIELENTTTLYSADMLNPECPGDATYTVDSEAEKARHVAMLFADQQREQIIMGFEDLHRTERSANDYNITSDEDFNDAIFVVESSPVTALAGSNIAAADPAFNPRPADLTLNPDCCGIDTTGILEDELPERTNVQAEFLNPQYTPTIVISESTQLLLSFVGEGAIYQNSLGYIVYPTGLLDGLQAADADADGDGVVEPWELRLLPGVETGMVFAHASAAGQGGALVPTEAVIVGGDRVFESGTSVDFFLVQDGWNDDRTVKDYTRDSAEDTMTFYTIDALNPEPVPMRHVAMMFTNDELNSILFGFEDLHRVDPLRNPDGYATDEDFNDNVFCVSPIVTGALSQTAIPVAEEPCPADLNGDGRLDKEDLHIAAALYGKPDRVYAKTKKDVRFEDPMRRFAREFMAGCP